MLGIATLLIVVLLSVIITRIAAVALMLTGLSRDCARFQARSAFTGCGFTTAEAEHLVSHPVRRRIIMLLMMLGNAGIITAVSSLILAFVQAETGVALWMRMVVLVAGIVGLWALACSSWITRWMERAIRWALRKYTNVEVRDYASLLRLSDDFAVSEMCVEEGDWVVGNSLAELDLHVEGITVLGIERSDGGYVAVPTGDTRIVSGDVLLLYGRAEAIDALNNRPKGSAGDKLHRDAVRREAERLRQQERAEQRRERRMATSDRGGT